jgi:hypothetical protein
MRWLNANAGALQGAATVLTAAIALAALVGVKVQIDAADRLAAEQSARDIYREFLALSLQNPKFSAAGGCVAEADRAAYGDYVDYMLYMAEQVLAADKDWQPAIDDLFERHGAAICAIDEAGLYAPDVAHMIDRFRKERCASAAKVCQ